MPAQLDRIARVALKQVLFGVRYEPHYGVVDYLGTILDEVLRRKGTPFGPETFPNTTAEATEHILINPGTNDYLRINQQDTILQMGVGDRSLSRISELADDFETYVLEAIGETAGLSSIVRYGMVLQLEDVRTLFKTPPSVRYLGTDFPDARSLFLRVSRRLPAEEALIKKRVEDYRNVIYMIHEAESGAIGIAVDYQHYFSPALDTSEWKERPFHKFVENGLAYFEGEFRRWLDQFFKASEVA